jgi:hypothetical protein
MRRREVKRFLDGIQETAWIGEATAAPQAE